MTGGLGIEHTSVVMECGSLKVISPVRQVDRVESVIHSGMTLMLES